MSHPLNNLTLRQLRAFAATLAGGSQAAAAQRLGVTQPAVTLQLRNLRDLAGVELLQRTDKGVLPTDAGRALLELNERIALALDDCVQLLETIKGATGGRVAVGAVSTAKYFVPATIGAFAQRFPDIEFKLTIGNRSQVMQGLRDYSLDLAITGRPPEDMALESRLIGDHPNIIIAKAGHPLASRKGLELRELAHEAFLMREQGSGTRQLMQRLTDDADFQPKIGMEFDSNETIKQAVMAGLGIAFISAHTVASEIEHGRLSVLDVVGLPMVRQWFVLRRIDKRLLPPAAAFQDFLSREAARFLPAPPHHDDRPKRCGARVG
jgi:LysR family transcriptional regulator, low CO2-responsive transcriptional regulator